MPFSAVDECSADIWCECRQCSDGFDTDTDNDADTCPHCGFGLIRGACEYDCSIVVYDVAVCTFDISPDMSANETDDSEDDSL